MHPLCRSLLPCLVPCHAVPCLALPCAYLCCDPVDGCALCVRVCVCGCVRRRQCAVSFGTCCMWHATNRPECNNSCNKPPANGIANSKRWANACNLLLESLRFRLEYLISRRPQNQTALHSVHLKYMQRLLLFFSSFSHFLSETVR